jgi:hypothetical protein
MNGSLKYYSFDGGNVAAEYTCLKLKANLFQSLCCFLVVYSMTWVFFA